MILRGDYMKIEISNVSKSYKRKKVLTNITFTAQSGKCIGVLGVNGCGKSTLLSILAGIQKGDSGSFICDGHDLFKNSKKRSELVGYVPQGTPLIDELTAYDNLLLWYDRKQIKQELQDGILKLLGIDEFLMVPVHNMSGGMKKRLSIGCAMAKKPPIIILDEPMAALDIACKQKIFEYLNSHKMSGGILLLATHDAMELELCDECYIIKDGENTPFTYEGNIENLVKNL